MKKAFLFLLSALTLTMTLTACGGETAEPAAEVDLQAFYQGLTETYSADFNWNDYLVDIEDEMLETYYPGLSAIPAKQLVAKMPMMSAAVNEFVFMQCETEEDAARAAEIFQSRIDYQAGDENNPGGAWYPESIEAWKKAAVIQHGSYVALIASTDYQDGVAEQFNALFA